MPLINPYEAHKIIDHLYQGGFPPPGDGLSKAGINVLVLCAKDYQDASPYEGVEVILAPGADDHRHHRLLQTIDVWKAAANSAALHVKSGRNVLVTCMQGLNRSGLVNALVVRELTGWPGKRIVEHIQRSRPGSLFNTTFTDYIEKEFP